MGKAQHGFKKSHSTCTLSGLTVQSVLTHALDEKNYALMAGLDLRGRPGKRKTTAEKIKNCWSPSGRPLAC